VGDFDYHRVMIGRMRAWMLEGPGGPEAFRLIERDLPALAPGFVLIAVEGFGLNRSELHSRKGLAGPDFRFPRVLGLECVGRVLDPNQSLLVAGDRVIALMGGMGRSFDGSYATHVAVPRQQVFRAPDSLPSETLAAIPETYNTAWGVCVENLALVAGETVLVRGGTSALGMAAIAIAKQRGCRVVATSRSADKAMVLRSRSEVDEVVVEGERFADRVIEAVGPVDAVVECVGSTPSIESSCATMSGGGRLGLVGQLTETWDTDAAPRIPANVSRAWTRSDLVASPRDDARMQEILDAVVDGKLPPNIHQVFTFEQLPEAHRVMDESAAVGKLVVLV